MQSKGWGRKGQQHMGMGEERSNTKAQYELEKTTEEKE